MNHQFWPLWVQKLQHSPFKGFVLTFLEGSGPFKLILAQVMLAGLPFLNASVSWHWQAAAEMLENDSESREFAALLHEESFN